MKKFLLAICPLGLIVGFVASCSSIKAPSLEKAPEKNIESLNIVDSWKQNNCSGYQKLATNKSFPLYQLASLRASLYCNETSVISSIISEADVPTWMLKHYFEIKRDLSLKNKNDNDYAYALYRLSDYLKRNDEKETMLLEALSKTNRVEFQDEINQKLYQISPRLNLTKTPENYFYIAQDFEKNRDFKNANHYYRLALNLLDLKTEAGTSDAVKIYHRLKQMNRNLKGRNDYYTLLDEAIKVLSPIGRRDFYIERARGYWTDGDISLAHKELNKLLITESDVNVKSHVLWILAQIDLEEKKFTSMIKLLTIALKNKPTDNNIDNDIFEKVLWSLAWAYHQTKQYNNAVDIIEEHLETIKNSDNFVRFKYWLGHFHERAGRISKAQEIWRELTENHALNYYGILAHRDLNISLTPLKNSEIKEYSDNLFYWLLDLGESKLLQDYLNFLSRKSNDFDYKLSLFPLYEKASYPYGGIQLYFSLNKEERERAFTLYPQIAYPIAYDNYIKKDRELILSIMRQESLFDVNARSFADAFGVLQLIPSVAKEVAGKHNIPYNDFKDLYDPKTNIELGTALIDDLKNRFQKRFPFYIAAYNAGQRPVGSWDDKRYKGIDIEFIEEIPYAETQKYVKLIFRNLFIYKRLLSDENFGFPINFWTEGFI